MSDEPRPKYGVPVPHSNRELTRRSSALARRGLDALTVQQTRIVRFPPERSMGRLYIPLTVRAGTEVSRRRVFYPSFLHRWAGYCEGHTAFVSRLANSCGPWITVLIVSIAKDQP